VLVITAFRKISSGAGRGGYPVQRSTGDRFEPPGRPGFDRYLGACEAAGLQGDHWQYAIYAPEKTDTAGRMQVIRASIRHLQQGGALLIFPRGGIEADPEFMPQPDGEFNHWSRSLEIFMQRVPDLQILVTIASGVISRAAMQHPVTWFRKARPDRQRLAFIYQFIRQMVSGRQIFDLTPRVTFGEIVTGHNHNHMRSEIEQAARRTLRQHMTWAQV
jgi:hypothetical protein